jgi:hypothetical protein
MLAAQVSCWLQEQSDTSGATDESAGDQTDATDTSSDASAPDHPHGKSDAAHQRKLDRAGGKPAWLSEKSHGPSGKGHGHGHSF